MIKTILIHTFHIFPGPISFSNFFFPSFLLLKINVSTNKISSTCTYNIFFSAFTSLLFTHNVIHFTTFQTGNPMSNTDTEQHHTFQMSETCVSSFPLYYRFMWHTYHVISVRCETTFI